MKILLSWLREFVDVPGTPEEIASTMSLRGFAVESIETVADSSAALATSDAILDFEITANRPDCMSVLGMAREVATAYGLPLEGPVAAREDQVPASSADGGAAGTPVDIVIDNPDLCSVYAGAVADVRVGPSPAWMQARLTAAGVRPINNIVDITAYVMLEMGQPMHAFDYAAIGGARIRVRTARVGEGIITLDNQQRELRPDMLVIADAGRPVAIAGVMGGAESGVTGNTGVALFESAHFDPLSVRRTSRRLGLKTDASMRFERGTDPSMPERALVRACQLLAELTCGTVRERRTATGRRPGVRTLAVRREKIAGLLGVEIPETDVRRILSSLGFTLEEGPGGWTATVPPRRVDVLREVDLIEEVARHFGFDRIPVRFPRLDSAPAPPDPRVSRARQLRSLMIGAGFSEALTFGFIGRDAAAPFAPEGELVQIANPLSENFAVLRPSALPGLLDAVARNRRRQQPEVRVFEIGNRFSNAGERRALACAWSGSVGGDHWSGGTRPVDFFDIKGIVERVCEGLGLTPRTGPHREKWLVDGRAAAAMADGIRVAVFGQLAPSIAETHGVPGGEAVYVAEIDLEAADALAATDVRRVQPLPKYPSVTRDISIVVDDTLTAAAVRNTIRETAPAELERVREFDRYQGKGVPAGKVSLSLRLTFRSSDRTLTDSDVQSAMEKVLAALRDQHAAVQR
jgi:phenylalanyl-tRNA synthetase beta chain